MLMLLKTLHVAPIAPSLLREQYNVFCIHGTVRYYRMFSRETEIRIVPYESIRYGTNEL